MIADYRGIKAVLERFVLFLIVAADDVEEDCSIMQCIAPSSTNLWLVLYKRILCCITLANHFCLLQFHFFAVSEKAVKSYSALKEASIHDRTSLSQSISNVIDHVLSRVDHMNLMKNVLISWNILYR